MLRLFASKSNIYIPLMAEESRFLNFICVSQCGIVLNACPQLWRAIACAQSSLSIIDILGYVIEIDGTDTSNNIDNITPFTTAVEKNVISLRSLPISI